MHGFTDECNGHWTRETFSLDNPLPTSWILLFRLIWKFWEIDCPYSSMPRHFQVPWSSSVRFRNRNRKPDVRRSAVILKKPFQWNKRTNIDVLFIFTVVEYFLRCQYSMVIAKRLDAQTNEKKKIPSTIEFQHKPTRILPWPVHEAIKDLYWSRRRVFSVGLTTNWLSMIGIQKITRRIFLSLSSNSNKSMSY